MTPFKSYAGYGVGNGFRQVEERCPNSQFLQGFFTSGGIERDGIYFVIEEEKLVDVQR